jgi:hypothetical protein
MTEPPEKVPELANFFEKPLEEQEAELRALAEKIGALPPARPFSPARTFVEAFVLTAVALLAAWFVWHHAHSIVAATLPLLLVVLRAFRRRPPRSGTKKEPGEP